MSTGAQNNRDNNLSRSIFKTNREVAGALHFIMLD